MFWHDFCVLTFYRAIIFKKMGLYCIVSGCNSTKYRRVDQEDKTDLVFFKFPTNTTLKEMWVKALLTLNGQNNADKLGKTSKVCALHFAEGSIERRGNSQYRLKQNAVPSIFPNTPQNSEEDRVFFDEPAMEFSDDILSESSLVSECNLMETTSTTETAAIRETTATTETAATTETSAMIEMTASTSQQAEYETPKKTIRYPGDISSSMMQNMTPRYTDHCVQVLKRTLEKKNHLIKKLQTQKNRQKKQLINLKRLLHELQQKFQLLSNSKSKNIQAITEESSIIKDIETGKVNGQYPPRLRTFARIVNFYSPRAYNYIRQVFQQKLPSPSAIRAWYNNNHGSPGFTQEAIEILKRKCTDADEQIKSQQ